MSANCLLKSPILFISGLKLEPNWIVSLSQPRLFLYCKINPSLFWNDSIIFIKHQEAFDDIKRYFANPPVLVPLVKGKDLRLYIAKSNSTIASMLVQKDDNDIERVVYYLSRILNDVEIRYSAIE